MGNQNEDLRHCEIQGCHEIYYLEKNGGMCETCAMSACEFCLSSKGLWINSGDDWICPDCKKENALEEKNARRKKYYVNLAINKN